MKTKKLLIAGLFLATACGVAYCSTAATESAESGVKLTGVKVDHTESIDFSHFKWLKQYPQLANIESNNQTAMIDKLRTSESISQLIGPINNPYGVRDDILYEIISIVPESQPLLLRAAIKSAFYDNLSSFSKSDADKLLYTRKSTLAMICMAKFDKSDYIIPHEINQISERKLYDTKARHDYQRHLEETIFAWQTLGSGYGTVTEDEKCKNGDY